MVVKIQMNPKHIGSVLALLLVGTSFADSLVVGKGNPQSLAEGAYSYDSIELHDNLTLAPGAIITMIDSTTHADKFFLGSGAGELPVLTIVGQSQVKCTSGKAGCLCIGGSGEVGSGGVRRDVRRLSRRGVVRGSHQDRHGDVHGQSAQRPYGECP